MEGPVTALAAGPDGLWAIVSDDAVWRSAGEQWRPVAEVRNHRARCVLPVEEGALVGTSEAHLFLVRDGTIGPVAAFDEAPGRDDWYTPWGGPPDTRSLARGGDGALYANVHVGGILRSSDGGDGWEATIDIDADVHQVVTHPDHPRVVLAACARGLAGSEDGGATWVVETQGLHATYCRAVAVAGESVLVTASTGPFTDRAAVYRVPFAGLPGFERCTNGLPEWFGSNIDSHCLAAAGGLAALGTEDGSVFRSDDEGRTWEMAAEGLPPVRAVAVVP
ncbi:MAG: WD40/YVTN/BNR-like repeat-containing protein [Actinomycetota bacterium]